MAGFRNNFKDHRRFSEHFLQTQATIPGRFSQLVSDFIEASWNLILYVLHKKTAKIPSALIQKVQFLKILISWQYPFKHQDLCHGKLTYSHLTTYLPPGCFFSINYTQDRGRTIKQSVKKIIILQPASLTKKFECTVPSSYKWWKIIYFCEINNKVGLYVFFIFTVLH